MPSCRVRRPSPPHTQRGGYLLLEALIATGVFAVLIGAVSFALFYGQEGALKSGDRVRGVALAEEALGAARAIRDQDFALLTAGRHGICIGATGLWEFCGTETQTADGYTTHITLESLAEDRVRATAATVWDFGLSRSGSVLLSEEFTDWRAVKPIGNWAITTLRGSYVDAGLPLFNHIVLNGSFAFITSETGDGGSGLYVFDVSDPDDPQRRAAGLSLGAAGYGLVADGDVLYVSTGDPGAEVKIFDISNPALLSGDDLIASINIPGDARARSLALFATTLFVGTTESGMEEEFYAYDVGNPLSADLLGTLEDTGSMQDMTLQDGYAYVASSMDAGELRVVDVFDPEDLALASGGGYNLTDVHDGLAVATVGEYVLLGRRSGEVIEELVLFSLSGGPVPAPPPGPWYQEIAGDVTGIDAEPGARYAFIATNNDAAELQVIDLARFAQGQTPVVETANPDAGGGRAVAYDMQNDRIILATDRAVLVYTPAP